MEDPRLTVKKLMAMALDERGKAENERASMAFQALRIIEKHNLLGVHGPERARARHPVETVVSVVETVTNPDFVEQTADRVDRVVNGVERIMGSVGRVAKKTRRVDETRRRRTYR